MFGHGQHPRVVIGVCELQVLEDRLLRSHHGERGDAEAGRDRLNLCGAWRGLQVFANGRLHAAVAEHLQRGAGLAAAGVVPDRDVHRISRRRVWRAH